VREFIEDPFEVGKGICHEATDLLNESVDDGASPSGIHAAHEHPILVTQFGGAMGLEFSSRS
jgi:hypothetical protein